LGAGQVKVSRTVHVSTSPSPVPWAEGDEIRPIDRVYTKGQQRPWEVRGLVSSGPGGGASRYA